MTTRTPSLERRSGGQRVSERLRLAAPAERDRRDRKVGGRVLRRSPEPASGRAPEREAPPADVRESDDAEA